MFCRNALGLFSRAKKDILYDFVKREDVDWRRFNLDTAKEVYGRQGLDASRVKAYVLGDSVKGRRGKKMEGVSSHYDHLTNRHVMGQQVLTLGLATEEAFFAVGLADLRESGEGAGAQSVVQGQSEYCGSEVPGGHDAGQAGDGHRDDEASEASWSGRGLLGGRCLVWHEDADSGGVGLKLIHQAAR